MTAKKVRLRDVAEASGTSTKTASRVINGDPRVAEETRRRVQEVADQLGYRVDVMARSLRKGVDATIGVVVPTIGDPFFASMIEEIEGLALARGVNLLVASNSRDSTHERELIEGLLARRVAGLIVVPYTADYSFLNHVTSQVVFLDRHPSGLVRDTVLVDDIAGAELAVRHLAAAGHRRIAFIGDETSVQTSAARLRGYRNVLAEHGIADDPELQSMACENTVHAIAATHALLDLPKPPTAIFSSRSEATLGVVQVLHQRGRTDVALVSFGDFAMADVLSPAVTVIDHDPRVLARRAMERLAARMDGDASAPADVVVPLQLVPRGSGELPPAPSLMNAQKSA